jgi:hypothetical protein
MNRAANGALTTQREPAMTTDDEDYETLPISNPLILDHLQRVMSALDADDQQGARETINGMFAALGLPRGPL